MNIRSKGGKRSIELHAAEVRALSKAATICGEIAELMNDTIAEKARENVQATLAKYAPAPANAEATTEK